MNEKICIVFDGPPGHEGGRFVEVENEHGESVRVGRWVERPNGYWALQLDAPTTSDYTAALKSLLHRIVKYATEDRATTARATRLSRALDEARRLLQGS